MRSAVLLLLATLVTPSLAAQSSRLGPVEKRPKLQAGADTNDASSYFQHATRVLAEKPAEASQAFYWAARLDPGSAEALDGRRASMIMRTGMPRREAARSSARTDRATPSFPTMK